MDERYHIQINMPINRNDMISEIKSLKKRIPVVNQTKYSPEYTKPKSPEPKAKINPIIEPIKEVKEKPKSESKQVIIQDEPEQILFSSHTKKKKKNKKHSGLNATMMSMGTITDFSEENEIGNKNDDALSNLIDIDELLHRDEDDDIEDGIIDEQRRGYDKLKKQDNPYKKEFAEELTLLYALLNEVNIFSKDLEKKYRQMEDAKVRGISKYITDLAQTVLASKVNKLSVIKEIANVKKIVTDFKFKVDAKTKEAEGGNSNDRLASAYLSKIISHGRGNFIRDYGNTKEDEGLDPRELLGNLRGMSDNDEDTDRYDQMIQDRLDGMDRPFRSEAGNKYIEYENRGVQIYIKKCIDTGEWHFIALDRDSQQINDYPIPTKRDVGKIKFSNDGNYATDVSGRAYKVIEWYSPTDN